MKNNNRITNHPILGKLEQGKKITFQFDGKEYNGFEGDTIASALLANGVRTLREHEETGTKRGIYCNIGHCYECRVTVNDERNIRACLTLITENMNIKSGIKLPHPLHPNNEQENLRTYEQYEKWLQRKGQQNV